MLLSEIFKRTSTGAVQTWRREIEGSKYRTISGQQFGAKVASEWTQCIGKNIGKANETSPADQATAECDAAYKKKLAQGGYHENLSEIDTAKFFKPMLAKKYEGLKSFDNVFAQRKYDGIRCCSDKDGLWTRQGKPIVAAPHIVESLKEYFQENPDSVLDGELYNHSLKDDFNKIISLVRKQKPTAENLAESKSLVEYHVYDVPSVQSGFENRYTKIPHGLPYVIPVETQKIATEEELDAAYAACLADGYEGQIVRLGGTPYEQKRSKQLLKRKEFTDGEFIIVKICEGLGNRSGMAGYITYENEDGSTFNSGIAGGEIYYKQLLKDASAYVGGQGTVTYFGLTPDGVPRFPVTKVVYKKERWG